MKIADLLLLKKNLLEQEFSICLVVAKEDEAAVEMILKKWKDPLTIMEGESFSRALFEKETCTLPFLSQKVVVHVKGIEKLSKEALEAISAYVENPSAWVQLLLSGASAPASLIKKIDTKGLVVQLREEKPWDKEKSLAEWAVQEAKQEGYEIAFPLAKALVGALKGERLALQNELKKLFCYMGEKKRITEKEMKEISCSLFHHTLWQLGEAIFALQPKEAIKIGRAFLEEEEEVFLLLAHLRTQMRQGWKILEAHHEGGLEQVAALFPQWKEGFVRKKLEEARHYGKKRLQKALVLIFEAEVKAKNSTIDPFLLLDTLLIQLTERTHAPFATA